MRDFQVPIFVLSVLFTVIGFLVVWIMNSMKSDIRETKHVLERVSTSMQDLSVNIVVLGHKAEQHDEKIRRIENLIDQLESLIQ